MIAKTNLFSGLVGATLAAEPKVNVQVVPTEDPSYGGIFTTTKPEPHPDDYFQPQDKQDTFDWRLSKVRIIASIKSS